MKKRIQWLSWMCLLSCCALRAQQPPLGKVDYRYVTFILGLDEKDMFNDELKYVKIKVRKKFDNGNLFTDSVVIDKKYLIENGASVSMKYEQGGDKNSHVFEYQIQWEDNDGHVFPLVPLWEKGNWSGNTLTAPVQPHTIEFEANQEQLKEMGIGKVTLQVRYKKFNEEIEDNLHISQEQAYALVSKRIYTNKNTRSYVYRLIFNHVTEGKLILPWRVSRNEHYVFANIPPDLMDKSSTTFQKAKCLGEITKSSDGKIVNAEKVLDFFDISKK